MPIGETTAIIYLSPIVVMILAFPILRERVAPTTWVLAAVAFAGVALVVRPSGELNLYGVIFTVANIIAISSYHLTTRILTKSETTMAMVFTTAWVGFLCFATLSLPHVASLSVAPLHLMVMVAIGVLQTIGQFFFTAAFHHATASELAPVNYLHVVWAGCLGWIVFDHLPDTISLIGMALICVAGGITALLGRPRHLQDAPPEAG
jgi:drug/metabolite transporter (DMT)-like permease